MWNFSLSHIPPFIFSLQEISASLSFQHVIIEQVFVVVLFFLVCLVVLCFVFCFFFASAGCDTLESLASKSSVAVKVQFIRS